MREGHWFRRVVRLAGQGCVLWGTGVCARAFWCGLGVFFWSKSAHCPCFLSTCARCRTAPSARAGFVLGAAKAEDVSTWEYPFSQQDQSDSSWKWNHPIEAWTLVLEINPCGAALRAAVTAWLLSLSLSRPGTNSRCLGKTVKVQARSSAFPMYFPSFQQSASHKLPEAEMVSLV